MTTWLHFIGKKYYATDVRFVREAQRFGITRRVSLAVLRKMAWGDRVLLAQLSGRSSVIFGQFTITRLSGLNPDGGAALAQACAGDVEIREYPQPRRVERGCGSYMVHGEMVVRHTPLEKITEALRSVKNPGALMVGGQFVPLWTDLQLADHSPLRQVQRVRVKSIPFAQGFRPFAFDEFRSEVIAQHGWTKPGRLVTVEGFFYAKTDHELAVEAGVAELVEGYRRGSHYEQGEIDL